MTQTQSENSSNSSPSASDKAVLKERLLEVRGLFLSSQWLVASQSLDRLRMQLLGELVRASNFETTLRLQGQIEILESLTDGTFEAATVDVENPRAITPTTDLTYMRSDQLQEDSNAS